MKNLILGLCLAIGVSAVVAWAGPTYRDQAQPSQECLVKYAVIDHAGSGDNTIVAAVTSRKIRVINYKLNAASAVTIRWEGGASGTALTGQMQLAANVADGASCGFAGCFETASGVLLNLELSGAISVDGHVAYCEVP